MNELKSDYWNRFYSKRQTKLIPSQFAAFILNEYSERSNFIDVGCGTGRDSFFFVSYGKSVLAIDGSEKAVEQIRAISIKNGSTLNIKLCDFSSIDCPEKISKEIAETTESPVIYARFLLHALNDEEIDIFLKFSRKSMGPNGVLCLEYRTEKDRKLKKITEAHYRNFIKVEHLESKINALGMKTTYFSEGYGYAKYKEEDAYVARNIVEPK